MLDEFAYLQLWQKIIKGDRKAFEKLFDALGKELVSYAYKISLDRALAKDAVQDVFVDLWLYRSNLNEDVQVKFYLYRCVRRATTKLLRRDNQENTEAQWYPMDFEADELSQKCCCVESNRKVFKKHKLKNL
jgi:RNA polymerase sigma factor (sigma-70 family)